MKLPKFDSINFTQVLENILDEIHFLPKKDDESTGLEFSFVYGEEVRKVAMVHQSKFDKNMV